MKNLKFLLYLISLCLMLSSCGNDDNDDNGHGKEETNLNKNKVTTDAAVTRLEFPRLKGGNNIVIVYRTKSDSYDKDGVNFCVEWDSDKKSQRWSCYQLHQGYTGTYDRVTDGRYYNDPTLDKNSYWEEDYYYGSGYEHGHICPNADRKYSYTANYQTFYMTNMQPQYHKFNGYTNSGQDQGEGLWLRMESKVRSWVPRAKTDTLYVCKGGTIDNENQIIERIQGKLIVPKYFFMACLLKNSEGYRAIGFWAEQKKNEWRDEDNLSEYAVTIDKLEELTGIDFFCNLPDDKENKAESSIALKAWGM